MDSILGNLGQAGGAPLQGVTLGKLQGGLLKPDAGQKETDAGDALGTFGDMLKNQLAKVNTTQTVADDAVQTYAVGGDIELHNVILAVEKAEMSLTLATQIRNKMVSAYQEVSRMNI